MLSLGPKGNGVEALGKPKVNDVQLVVLNEPKSPGNERATYFLEILEKAFIPCVLGGVFAASPVSCSTPRTQRSLATGPGLLLKDASSPEIFAVSDFSSISI